MLLKFLCNENLIPKHSRQFIKCYLELEKQSLNLDPVCTQKIHPKFMNSCFY